MLRPFGSMAGGEKGEESGGEARREEGGVDVQTRAKAGFEKTTGQQVALPSIKAVERDGATRLGPKCAAASAASKEHQAPASHPRPIRAQLPGRRAASWIRMALCFCCISQRTARNTAPLLHASCLRISRNLVMLPRPIAARCCPPRSGSVGSLLSLRWTSASAPAPSLTDTCRHHTMMVTKSTQRYSRLLTPLSNASQAGNWTAECLTLPAPLLVWSIWGAEGLSGSPGSPTPARISSFSALRSA